ncbi:MULTISPECIES: S8 family serine peptidase [Aneurinibacillus]|jgi:subtilisin family serine protease|uniref:S8 family serine peptidase n=1 Tax=Aneurinibacillus thermoaerophilus TaxID=143495 RepID=A0A1G7XY65_ANETH|nr:MULTISPECIES: S8 family serine peptidase [Aneurinibacillus]AMA73014.1 hypothetical protein ACH33_09185 [Aneurinibacillus sp. XH2]MED0675966.1 S8 family serine peptidase [Aneurinibacillus thermoaerophilus]MED0677758.1 S8 family serine peptidase [Aneurinibacillus thermoaerophilus]MED0737508.1 S8 family serine peptidase [Aneurinibacillus thermoaerophilus]MED0758079.1 S8 family serine peptidase [Aneurinibacillus thermoaerophilus]
MRRWKGDMAKQVWGRGENIRIAQIDSGVNAHHSHIGKVAGGLAFHVSDEGMIRISDAYHDRLGHGTAVAGVLYEHVPDAEIWAVKIFHETLSAHIEVLCAAIEWCIDARMHIINLSLGVRRDVKELRDVCEKAERAGIVIVSACDKGRGLLWPGYYPSVFAVQASEDCRADEFYYHADEPVSFSALGLPKRLEGPLQKFNLQGHSFAAAHMTGFIAKWMEKYALRSSREIKKLLTFDFSLIG